MAGDAAYSLNCDRNVLHVKAYDAIGIVAVYLRFQLASVSINTRGGSVGTLEMYEIEGTEL